MKEDIALQNTNNKNDNQVCGDDSPWFIYQLADPRDGKARYVGKTTDVKKRLVGHLADAKTRKKRFHRLNWIRRLMFDGVVPKLSILESGVGSTWRDAEKRWIKTLRDDGLDLVNGTDGGDGSCGMSPEIRRKIGDAHRGTHLSVETREKIAAALRGRTLSLECVKKLSAIRCGRVLSPEVHEKLMVIFRSPEYRAKLSVSQHGIPKSFEHREKIGAAHRGKRLSWKTKEKIALAHRGKPLSLGHRARISAGLRGHACSLETRKKIATANCRRAGKKCEQIACMIEK